MEKNGQLLNFVNGSWQKSGAGEHLDVLNPATDRKLGVVPLSPGTEVGAAARAACAALPGCLRRAAGLAAHAGR